MKGKYRAQRLGPGCHVLHGTTLSAEQSEHLTQDLYYTMDVYDTQ